MEPGTWNIPVQVDSGKAFTDHCCLVRLVRDLIGGYLLFSPFTPGSHGNLPIVLPSPVNVPFSAVSAIKTGLVTSEETR